MVGDEKQKFAVHEDLICRSSEFFKAAVSKGWKEEQDREVYLPEQQPLAFQTYLQFIYNPDFDLLALAKIYANGVRQADEKALPLTLAHENGLALVRSSILGDYIGDKCFKNLVIRRVFEGFDGNQVGWSYVNYIESAERSDQRKTC